VRRHFLLIPLVVPLVMVLLAPTARAGTLDRVRADHVLHCGGAIRPGLAFPAADHSWQGLEVEICRAVAVAANGPDARIAFHSYVSAKDFARLASGQDALGFLTGSELLANGLAGAMLPGPAVFYVADGIMVWQSSPARHIADLSGTMVCAEPGTGPERALAAYFRAHHFALNFSGWQEAEEMMDAFDVGRCPAVAQEITALAALRLNSESEGHPARILPETMAASPLLAVTGLGDGAWSAIVAWTIDTLLQGETDPDALAIHAPELGLAPGWQARVIATVGHYGDIHRRTLGEDSPLELPRGLNARWDEGGLLCPPSAQ
jgi:general L-amino acid transport system substrate-binding protein